MPHFHRRIAGNSPVASIANHGNPGRSVADPVTC
jgi:hypothetical protein